MSLETDISAADNKTEVVIRHYGLLQPIDWDDDCEDELLLMDKLWNSLIDIHERYVDFYHAEIQKDPDLTAAKSRYDILVQNNSALSAIAEAKKNLAILQIDVTRRMSSELRALEMARREEVKIARQNSGLWWGNYNALIRAFEKARSAAIRNGNKIRRRSPGGNGRFTNTLQGGADVEQLFDGSLSQIMVRPPSSLAWTAESRGARRRLQRTQLTATVFVRSGERRSVTWPMMMHRPIPADCRVKEVVITRRQVGGKWKWAASFICRHATDKRLVMSAGSKPVAVDIGWRRVSEGLRVATIMPTGVAPFVIILPEDMLASFAFIDELRDRVQTSARVGLELLQSTDVASFKQPYQDLLSALQDIEEKKFAALNKFCRSSFFTRQSKEAIGPEIIAWRSEHVKLTTWLSNQQRKSVARRKHLYQNTAADILSGASEIIVNDIKFGAIASRGKSNSDFGFFPRRANYYRVVAAPSEFVRCLKQQAEKRGITFSKRNVPTPVPCPECGSTARTTRADVSPQICAACNSSFDQDEAACRSLLSQTDRARKTPIDTDTTVESS